MAIVCGWCGHPAEADPCVRCGHPPARAWDQRGLAVPDAPAPAEGRPELDAATVRGRYEAARADLLARGREPTVDALAEVLDRSPRTVRDWRRRFALT